MISRQTLLALLLALLLGAGLRLWALEHPDDCDRLDVRTRKPPSAVLVDSGSTMVMMPCNFWVPRQTLTVQGLCFADGALVVVFLVSFWSDRKRSRGARPML